MQTNCIWLQTTQPTSGGAVTADSSCCANCVEPPCPQQWGPDLPFFGHADPLDGWRCCSQKRVMSRPIQVRQLQTRKSGFVISAINKYMSESRYPEGATELNTGCTSDVQVSAKHNTQIPEPAINTENPDSHITQT